MAEPIELSKFEQICGAEKNELYCTLPRGHAGDHRAETKHGAVHDRW